MAHGQEKVKLGRNQGTSSPLFREIKEIRSLVGKEKQETEGGGKGLTLGDARVCSVSMATSEEGEKMSISSKGEAKPATHSISQVKTTKKERM